MFVFFPTYVLSYDQRKFITPEQCMSGEKLINSYDSHPIPKPYINFYLISIQEYPLHAKLQILVEYLQIVQASGHHFLASTTATASSAEAILQITIFPSRFLMCLSLLPNPLAPAYHHTKEIKPNKINQEMQGKRRKNIAE